MAIKFMVHMKNSPKHVIAVHFYLTNRTVWKLNKHFDTSAMSALFSPAITRFVFTLALSCIYRRIFSINGKEK